MTGGIELERLMRHVDGELPAQERAALDARLAGHGRARSALGWLAEQRSLAAAAFRDDLAAPVPAELGAAVAAGFAARRRRARWRRYRAVGLPVAASFLCALFGGWIGFELAARRLDGVLAELQAAQAQDRTLMSATLERAMEQMRSGQAATWTNDTTGAVGSIMPLRTFRTASGKWCREFERSVTSPSGAENRIGIACRDEDGHWQLALERPKPV
jgi:surface antigen